MSATPHADNPSVPDPTVGWVHPPSALDKRRAKLQSARLADEQAAAAVAELDGQLRDNTESNRQNDASLTILRDRVAELEKTLKADAKKGAKLRKARDRAREVRAEAQQRAVTAEAKYERAVLADLVRREKDNDLSAHPGTHPALVTPTGPDGGSEGSGPDGTGPGTTGTAASNNAAGHRPATVTSPRTPM
ncbi:MAG: hypothetical protein ABW212_08860 [Pseudonocardia sediminis]